MQITTFRGALGKLLFDLAAAVQMEGSHANKEWQQLNVRGSAQKPEPLKAQRGQEGPWAPGPTPQKPEHLPARRLLPLPVLCPQDAHACPAWDTQPLLTFPQFPARAESSSGTCTFPLSKWGREEPGGASVQVGTASRG